MIDITRVLDDIESDQSASSSQLLPIVYDELRKLAKHRMANERADHTLGTIGLVHEAYARLVGSETEQHWGSRGHFFAAAAEAMRRILINHARDKARLKRGGDRKRIDLDSIDIAESTAPGDLLDLDEALTRLGEENDKCGELVKLRFYGGLSVDQCSEMLGVNPTRCIHDQSWDSRVQMGHFSMVAANLVNCIMWACPERAAKRLRIAPVRYTSDTPTRVRAFPNLPRLHQPEQDASLAWLQRSVPPLQGAIGCSDASACPSSASLVGAQLTTVSVICRSCSWHRTVCPVLETECSVGAQKRPFRAVRMMTPTSRPSQTCF